MKNLLLRYFIKDWVDSKKTEVRQAYGNMASIVGIVANLLLSVIKIFIGYISGSIAIMSDAVNNISDAGNSLVTCLSFKISGKAPDLDHPYGHGRAEYLFSIAVAVVVMFVGIQFLVQSGRKIIAPEEVFFSFWIALGLLISIGIKIWLYYFYKGLGKELNSPILNATAADSLADILITSVVLIGLLASQFIEFPIDGYLGVIVSVAIIRSGFDIFKDSTSSLVGREPSKETVLAIAKKLKSYDGVFGIHDLMVHDYGPGKMFATVHVEVNASVDILVSHELIDQIEKEVWRDLGIRLTIHMDPVDDSVETMLLYQQISKVVKSYDIRYSIHDFRVVEDEEKKCFVFDLLIPYEDEHKPEEIERNITEKIKRLSKNYETQITIEQSYTGDLDIHG